MMPSPSGGRRPLARCRAMLVVVGGVLLEDHAQVPLVTPAWILPRHLPDQRRKPGIDWRPTS